MFIERSSFLGVAGLNPVYSINLCKNRDFEVSSEPIEGCRPITIFDLDLIDEKAKKINLDQIPYSQVTITVDDKIQITRLAEKRKRFERFFELLFSTGNGAINFDKNEKLYRLSCSRIDTFNINDIEMIKATSPLFQADLIKTPVIRNILIDLVKESEMIWHVLTNEDDDFPDNIITMFAPKEHYFIRVYHPTVETPTLN
jgi:hypothetical protein